MNVIFACAWGG